MSRGVAEANPVQAEYEAMAEYEVWPEYEAMASTRSRTEDEAMPGLGPGPRSGLAMVRPGLGLWPRPGLNHVDRELIVHD